MAVVQLKREPVRSENWQESDGEYAIRMQVANTQSQGVLLVIRLMFIAHVTTVGLIALMYGVETYLMYVGVIGSTGRVVTEAVVLSFLATFGVEVVGACAVAMRRYYSQSPFSKSR